MKLKIVNGGAELQVSDATFGQDYNEALVHQVVTAYRNAGRAGTKAQKIARRSARRRQEAACPEGHGPGARRLEPQPIWVGGGATFAAQPRDFAQKVNRKMYRGAIALDAVGARAPGSPGRHRRDRARGAEDQAAREQARRSWRSRTC